MRRSSFSEVQDLDDSFRSDADSSDLIDLGIDYKTKVFIVSNASMPSERVFESTLYEVEKTINQNNILPPSIIVIY